MKNKDVLAMEKAKIVGYAITTSVLPTTMHSKSSLRYRKDVARRNGQDCSIKLSFIWMIS